VDVEIASDVDLPESVRRLALLGYGSVGDLGFPGREAFDRDGDDVSGLAWRAAT
jgi:hypothetical protein